MSGNLPHAKIDVFETLTFFSNGRLGLGKMSFTNLSLKLVLYHPRL